MRAHTHGQLCIPNPPTCMVLVLQRKPEILEEIHIDTRRKRTKLLRIKVKTHLSCKYLADAFIQTDLSD